jgi:hypothetical protein
MKEKEKECFVFVKPIVTIEECRKFLKLNESDCSDVEVEEIINLLLNLVEIDYRAYLKRHREAKIISLEQKNEQEKLAA